MTTTMTSDDIDRRLDALLAFAPSGPVQVLRQYSAAMLTANTIQDLATEEFAIVAKELGHGPGEVRKHFKQILGYRRAVAAFDPQTLRIARVEETKTRRAHVLFNHGGRAAAEFLPDNESQPELSLRMVELDQRRRESTTDKQRAKILAEAQIVKAQGERLAHAAKAEEEVVAELLRRESKIGMISQGDLFIALEPRGVISDV